MCSVICSREIRKLLPCTVWILTLFVLSGENSQIQVWWGRSKTWNYGELLRFWHSHYTGNWLTLSPCWLLCIPTVWASIMARWGNSGIHTNAVQMLQGERRGSRIFIHRLSGRLIFPICLFVSEILVCLGNFSHEATHIWRIKGDFFFWLSLFSSCSFLYLKGQIH